ncbi:MAG: hypothetical protein KatS3mg119_1111 [Rhodothalassiaceae bacterium]|nr:MAG: hypothetical protein KatS3mg119_1111 [Rhodothalassiaceae bacterium]
MAARKLISIRGRGDSDEGASPGEDAPAVPQRELRLAVVCYGGVSLAVYMYGISREILGLVRASERFHRALAQGRDPAAPEAELAPAERVYLALLRRIGEHLSLRVIVDVLAGASAGGINAIMLGRALATDGALERHRHFWLKCADVGELLDPKARAGRFSKFLLRPAFWLYGQWCRLQYWRTKRFVHDPEVVRKLSLFVRSRWFHPPFSGTHMVELMLEALDALTPPAGEGGRLIPPRLPLDLFVTATDFWGYPVRLTLHDPKVVEEREHRRIFHFRHPAVDRDTLADDLSGANDPGLAFAARATSSFPGIFPAANLSELEEVLARRGQAWPARERFLETNFADLRREGFTPEASFFIDGSVLMNKPVSIALRAIEDHAAHREVDRRLVYVEPLPAEAQDREEATAPGWLRVIRSALAEIPRKQPIRDDLEALAELNAQLERVRRVAASVRPQVIRMVAEMLGPRVQPRPSAARLAKWRAQAHERAARESAFAYEGYARLKVRVVFDELVTHLAPHAGASERDAVRAALRRWAKAKDVLAIEDALAESAKGDDVGWIAFLRDFDLSFRIRRLRFMIRRVNELYVEGGDARTPEGRRWLDMTKKALYEVLEQHAALLFPAADATATTEMGPGPRRWTTKEVGARLAQIKDHWRLVERDAVLDEELSGWLAAAPSRALARELLSAFLGFVYYDVATWPMIVGLGRSELEPIKVDRIAVEDATSLHPGGARELLKGIEFQTFAGFFSERYRQNDYLWGRLTGAERLVDIVASAAPEAAAGLDLAAIKQAVFQAILDEEEPHLPLVGTLIAELRQRVAALGAGESAVDGPAENAGG